MSAKKVFFAKNKAKMVGNRHSGYKGPTYISKLDSDPIEKRLWHFEVKVAKGGGGGGRNNFSRQIRPFGIFLPVIMQY